MKSGADISRENDLGTWTRQRVKRLVHDLEMSQSKVGAKVVDWEHFRDTLEALKNYAEELPSENAEHVERLQRLLDDSPNTWTDFYGPSIRFALEAIHLLGK